MESPDHVAAVILGAGEARRFGSPKQLALLNGRTLLQHVVDAATEARLAPIVVVVPFDLPLDLADVTRVPNAHPERGISHSLRLGFAALLSDVEAAVILLGDQPTVDATLIRRLLAARGASPFVATRAGGLLMPPVLVERSHFDIVEQESGDIGLRQVLRSNAGLVSAIDVEDMPADVDTIGDLRAIGGG
jgi:CTP:molybdopterin cytidylyltransferase MocA